MPDLKAMLAEARTIAVVGCSDRPTRTSYAIARYLQEVGYRIIPVNPNITTCHGEPAYPNLESLPDDLEIDTVNIFPNPAYPAAAAQSVCSHRLKLEGDTRALRSGDVVLSARWRLA